MTKELKAIRDALDAAAYQMEFLPKKMEIINKAYEALDSIMAGGVELPLFGYEICGKDFFAGTMKNNGGKVDDIWWMTDITDYSDEAVQRQIKRVEFINRAMNTAAPKHGGE